MSTCVIHLENFSGPYGPGSVIKGKVVFNFVKPINTKGISIKLKGKEMNRWSDRFGGRSYPHVGKYKFLRHMYELSTAGYIPPGHYDYPFTFQLPTELPATFKGPYGGIDYTLKTVAVVSGLHFNIKGLLAIPVYSPVNLDLIKNELRLGPTSYSEMKTLCCWCCTKGAVSADVHLEREAFTAGDLVKVRVDVNNMSTMKVERVKTKVAYTLKSMVTTPRKRSKIRIIELAKVEDTGVEPQHQRTYNFAMTLPSGSTIPNFHDCKLFIMTAWIKVKLAIGGSHSDLSIIIPIKLGHILSNPRQY